MGITGLLGLAEGAGAARAAGAGEWAGCTVAVDSYCWLHRGAFACADRLARDLHTDVHIKYCMKYVNMLLSKNIKPILVFDGRHLPAKAATETKRRESRNIAKRRAAELLSLGQVEEARSFMRRSVDITHKMALALIQECRKRNVDCIVAPYEADSQLAYLNITNIAQLVITEDSDLLLFGCTKVLFKMDLEGNGMLVDATRLPLVMKCSIERYSFDKFRQMCIMSGCDYLASLPGIGLAKARQFINATLDPNIANALKKLPSFFNKSQLVVSDEYRENFLRAEATFKHQYVYDPIKREMVRLTDPHDEGTELELCSNAGSLLDPETAFQLALGNLDPFTLNKMDDWHPDRAHSSDHRTQFQGWNEPNVAKHPSIWHSSFANHIHDDFPWRRKAAKKLEPIIAPPVTRPRKQAVSMMRKVVPETQDEGLTMESLKSMYSVEPTNKKQKLDEEQITTLVKKSPHKRRNPFSKSTPHTITTTTEILTENFNWTEVDEHDTLTTTTESDCLTEVTEISPQKQKSPIIELKNRCFKKAIAKSSYSVLKKLSKFPRTILDDNVVESKFFNAFNSNDSGNGDNSEENDLLTNSQKENSPQKPNKVDIVIEISPQKTEDRKSPILEMRRLNHVCRNPFSMNDDLLNVDEVSLSEDSVIDNTYPMEKLITPVNSQDSFPQPTSDWKFCSQPPQPTTTTTTTTSLHIKSKAGCKAPGLRKRHSAPTLPSNQPTLLSKFGFHKKPVLKR